MSKCTNIQSKFWGKRLYHFDVIFDIIYDSISAEIPLKLILFFLEDEDGKSVF